MNSIKLFTCRSVESQLNRVKKASKIWYDSRTKVIQNLL
jgi:hypothetical protein